MTVQIFEQIDKHPLAVEAFNVLNKNGLIEPGAKVPGEWVEKALDKKYKKDASTNEMWKFLGPYLLLKNKIEAEGYFITQKGMDYPGFRILSSEEMAEHANKILMDNIASNYKVGYIMAAHDVSKLSEGQRKKHKHVQIKAAQSAIIQQKILMENTFF